jgi:AcrR family transcriptional regulator
MTMDNATRSERSRNAVLEAAIAIIARDGARRLTLDAIARESGISKGGLMHQFPTKGAVFKALLDRQVQYFGDFTRAYLAGSGTGRSQPHLAAEIATLREVITTPRSVVFAVLGAAAEEPGLLSTTREIDAKKIEVIKAEAPDPDLAMLRWVAAWGLALTVMVGSSPLSEEERERLFERLLDDRQWSAAPVADTQPRSPVSRGRKGKAADGRPSTVASRAAG